MSEFFDTFAFVFANLARIDTERGATYYAEENYTYQKREGA